MLINGERVAKDLATVNHAVRRWGNRIVEKSGELVDRLIAIAEKRSITVMTKDGEQFESEQVADENAMRAIEILAKLVAQQQKDDHHADKMAAPKQGPTINVGVKVENTADTGGSLARQVAERIRADRLLEQSPG